MGVLLFVRSWVSSAVSYAFCNMWAWVLSNCMVLWIYFDFRCVRLIFSTNILYQQFQSIFSCVIVWLWYWLTRIWLINNICPILNILIDVPMCLENIEDACGEITKEHSIAWLNMMNIFPFQISIPKFTMTVLIASPMLFLLIWIGFSVSHKLLSVVWEWYHVLTFICSFN